jgi:hypothetical protein
MEEIGFDLSHERATEFGVPRLVHFREVGGSCERREPIKAASDSGTRTSNSFNMTGTSRAGHLIGYREAAPVVDGSSAGFT